MTNPELNVSSSSGDDGAGQRIKVHIPRLKFNFSRKGSKNLCRSPNQLKKRLILQTIRM